MLELELVQFGQPLRAGEIRGLPLFLKLQFLGERIAQAALDEIDGEIRDINADPLATRLLRCVNRRAATAKRIKHHVAGIGIRADDAASTPESLQALRAMLNVRAMAYESVDQLQKTLAETVFSYADDKKKAAGRALGTLVEIITFYLLKTWGLSASVAIERGLEEYKNPDITHNVEYSLHPVKFIERLQFEKPDLPITPAKIFKYFGYRLQHLHGFEKKGHALVSSSGVLRNACVLGEENDVVLVGLVSLLNGNSLELDLVGQYRPPYAMFECKRVGVEEGNKKGPQTIEKAKQGAYVARTVSALQKIRIHSGELYGVIPKKDGTLYSKPYAKLIDEVVRSQDPELLRHFILTVGVVSNHGNWFTSDNPNKELRVLAQSYDWLLFLSDDGLAEFIRDILQSDAPKVAPAKAAFLASYTGTKKGNRFTKVQMALDADKVLQDYFAANLGRIEKWFNIVSPKGSSIERLKTQIDVLSKKDWSKILGT